MPNVPAKTREEIEKAKYLAEQLGATCVEALISWGVVMNACDAMPENDPSRGLRLAVAQAQGVEVVELAKRIAKLLRPAGR